MPTTTTPPRTKPRPRRTTEVKTEESKITVPGNGGVKVNRAVTILKSRAQLYRFWRNFENLTTVIKHPVRIVQISDTESEWTVSGPPGESEVSWRALIINDKPDSLIAWRSAEGAKVPHAGTIRFEEAPGDEGTEVSVSMEYSPPGGSLGSLIGKISGKEPGQQVADTLRRFKALMETGEMPTIDGQSVGGPQADEKGKK